MNNVQVVTADMADPFSLHLFLNTAYGPAKAGFLRAHGSWWHRGDRNRLVLLCGDQIAAYCGVIPTQCVIQGNKYPALWWVDLFVAPLFRGLGLQSLLDERIKRMGDLKLGFPNALAASVHRKHGWGLRGDGTLLILPLHPADVKQVRASIGLRHVLLRSAGQALEPAAALLRHRLGRYEPRTARLVQQPDLGQWADVFARYKPNGLATTDRDRDFIRWRFLESPYRSELAFYAAGPLRAPTHCLVARHMSSNGTSATRILDLFGDLSDAVTLRDIVTLASRDAMQRGATQVTAMLWLPSLRSVFRSIGFVFSVPARFCWHSGSMLAMQSIASASFYWTLADSDNDQPD